VILEIVSGINSSTALWYTSRATGVVALLLLTAVMLLGLLVAARPIRWRLLPSGAQPGGTGGRPPGRQLGLPGLPRFAVSGLHRNLSLLATAFVAIHVLTAVTDGYVNIPVTAAVVPLTSPYERFWLGLGAVSFDLMLAAVVTSLLRRHLSRKAWRAVHLTAYVSWPVAWFHSVFSSGDLQHGLLLYLAIACAIAVIAASLWRMSAAAKDVPRAERVGLFMSAVHGQGQHPKTQRPKTDSARQRERTLSQ
jgi:DMSO/TMAO reductase YedYZ heme-binding membrane subunit